MSNSKLWRDFKNETRQTDLGDFIFYSAVGSGSRAGGRVWNTIRVL